MKRKKQPMQKKPATSKKPAKSTMATKPVTPTKQPKRASASGTGTGSTWGANPSTNVWNTASNWSSGVVPTDAASFGASSQTGIIFAVGSSATVNSIEFEAGAPPYTLWFQAPEMGTSPTTPTLTIAGTGVSNLSVSAQRLVVAAASASRNNPQLEFINSASAGGMGVSYASGPTSPSSAGGGVIRFRGTSTAGAASFSVTTGSGTPPSSDSTVGGEVSFSEKASAGTAQFTILGSTSTTDGDTFGNVVFHDSSTAANATFTNIGGTQANGDGGNTQLYDTSTAAHALFHNLGSITAEANGGDTAFDGTASADHGQFHNYASTVSSGRGGVTSFNNNCPQIPASQGASAGNGHFHNYGAGAAGQGGGHVYFESVYGSPTAAQGTFINHGSAVSGDSSNVGRTVFSISAKPLDAFYPTAGNATFWNLPGSSNNAPGGLTQFTISPYPAKVCYGAAKGKGSAATNGPTAGLAMIINMGAVVSGAQGGQTLFNGTAGLPLPTAGSASMLALGGVNGGAGGSIVFAAYSSGGSAKVGLNGNGTLDVSGAGGAITLGTLDLAGGVIKSTLGTQTTSLVVSGNVTVTAPVTFSFVGGNGFATNTPYTILTGANVSSLSAREFLGYRIGSATPMFTIVGNSLQVIFK